MCKCECGNVKLVAGDALKRGLTKSCGCLQREIGAQNAQANKTHGMEGTRTYRCWANMIQRCTNPKNSKWARYGARGISVCDKWKTFAGFFEDMGECPLTFTIERKQNDANYTKENCCWLPHAKQARNRSNNRILNFNGVAKLAVEWAEVLGVSYGTLRMRLHRGWSIEQIINSKK